jgi:hypothetical protein
MQANSMEVQTVTISRSPVGMVWRWRSELGLLSGTTAGYLECAHCVGLVPAGIAFGAGAVSAGVLPWSRRFMLGRFWCLVARHRLQTVFWELRLHTRAYRLPLVLWIRPTPVGSRAWVLLRAGLCPADFEKVTDEIATACNARESRVTGSRRFKSLIQIDVIRRDLLAPGRVIPSRLPAGPVPLPDWLALPDDPDLEPVPGPARWPGTALPLDLEDDRS